MKTLNEYLALPYRMELVKDPDEGGFVVSFPDLPGCITCGETLEAAVANAADAKRAWLQAALEDGLPVREPDNLDRSLAEHARQEGISMNQYCVYLLSRNDAAAR